MDNKALNSTELNYGQCKRAPFHKNCHEWQITVFLYASEILASDRLSARFVTDFCHLSLKKGFVKRVPVY